MLTVTSTTAVNGDALAEEIAAAGYAHPTVTYYPADGADPATLVIDADGGLGEEDRAQIEQIVAAHVPPAPPLAPSRDELRQGIASATTVAGLREAVLAYIDAGAP